MSTWPEFIKSAEAVQPDEAAIEAVAAIFRDKLKATAPLQAEGISEHSLNRQLQSADDHVMALARRTLRNVEAAAVARCSPHLVSALPATVSGAASAKALANALAPGKVVDVADLLQKEGLTGLSYHLQANQSLFDTLMAPYFQGVLAPLDSGGFCWWPLCHS